MEPDTLVRFPLRALVSRLRGYWRQWVFRTDLWRILPAWLLPGLFTLLMGGIPPLVVRGNLWGPVLLFLVAAYLVRSLDEAWPGMLRGQGAHLLARANQAEQRGRLNQALRLARAACAVTEDFGVSSEARKAVARVLLRQGNGAAALEELSRLSPHVVFAPELRVQAHLRTGEATVALGLAQRLFLRDPQPRTARFIVEALEQLDRHADAQRFLSLAGEVAPPEPLPELPPAERYRAARPPPWEVPGSRRFLVPWVLFTVGGTLLAAVAMELPLCWWRPERAAEGYHEAAAFLLGALPGGLVGLAQAWVLRRRVPESHWWAGFTALGSGAGMLAVYFLVMGTAWGARPSPGVVLVALSLPGLVSVCIQASVLGRWIKGSVGWLFAMMGAVVLAELGVWGLLGSAWRAASPLVGHFTPATLGRWVVPGLESALLRGGVVGGVGGVLLSRALERNPWGRSPARFRGLAELRPLTARKRPTPLAGPGALPKELWVVAMSGKLFSPGADIVFYLPVKEFEQLGLEAFSPFFVIVPKRPESELAEAEPPRVGVLALLYRAWMTESRGSCKMTVRMLARVHLHGHCQSERGPRARIQVVEEAMPVQAQELLDRLRRQLRDYVRSTLDFTLEQALGLRDPLFLADFVAANLELSDEERRLLLEDPDPASRVERVCRWLERAMLDPTVPPPQDFYAPEVTPMFFTHAWGE